jgi:hypothetical protein
MLLATAKPTPALSPRQAGWADGLGGKHFRPYRWPGDDARAEYKRWYRLGAEQARDLAKLEWIEHNGGNPSL